MVNLGLVLDAIFDVPLYTTEYFRLPDGWFLSLTTATPSTRTTPLLIV
jgi:hypothetical protein